jgi:ubiquinol-cytochrome c reductase cytochrome b subunit
MNYNALERFESIMFITMEVNYGWLFKLVHRNNARVIFVALYFHLFKNIMFCRYRLSKVWYSGMMMMVIIMGAGFRGYVLVGSQMRLWAAIVITSLISVLPLNGESLIFFVWGGYRISWVTLQLLILVHFVLPFIVMFVMVFHLVSLHATGRTRLIFSHSGVEIISFFPYFWVKDIMNIVLYMVFFALILLFPYSMGEVELFEESNLLSSPAHIVPEWYFTLRYAILRRVPSKALGVLIMLIRVLILFLYPLSSSYITPASNTSHSLWVVIFSAQMYLSLLGISPISQPFMLLRLLATLFYFLIHISVIVLNIIVGHYFGVDGGNATQEFGRHEKQSWLSDSQRAWLRAQLKEWGKILQQALEA